jgi:phosphoribosyl 1,2-cyclic phosphodiesterase
MDRLRFQSFASGSSGNCYFIGNASQGILIDAGIGVRTIRRNLRAMGLDFRNLWGIFVTHDHADHIRAVGSLGEIHHVPVYATHKIHEGINRSYCVSEKLGSSRRYLEQFESIEIAGFKISSFPVSHDASDCVGYTIEYKGKRFTFATDLGYVSETAAFELKRANYMVFEANYDSRMLANGSYPAHLKSRILSNTGHLSNEQAGEFLAANYESHLDYVFLCHLSKENNHPDLAYSTVKAYLENKNVRVGEDVKLITLDRFHPTRLFIFD